MPVPLKSICNFYLSILNLQETATPLTETTSILMLISGILLLTLFAVLAILYITQRKKKQYRQQLDKQETEHLYTTHLMQSRLEVQEQTLKNMSAEMHDNIAQMLGAVKLQLHMLSGGAGNEEQKALTNEAAETMRDAIRDVRSMSHAMNGTYILRRGMIESIEKDLARIVAAHRIKCNFTQSGEVPHLGEDKELILFRIIQESVANAVTHGQPATLSVMLRYSPHLLEVQIEDNGKGFDMSQRRPGRAAGIMNIEERTRLLNGTVTITSEQNKGTRVHLNIPV